MIFLKIIGFSITLVLTTILRASPFVSATLVGQLGNQMFQIAAAASLALDNNASTAFPDLITSDEFNIPLNYREVFCQLETKITCPIQFHYFDPNCQYTPIPYRPNMCIRGWFQSEKYFCHHKKEIQNLFAPTSKINNYLETKYIDIINHPCTVSIHHRSYLIEDPKQTHHPTQPKEYYLKAISYYPEDALFVVCSNDLNWCKQNFDDIPRTFVYIENEPHFHDLYLMSMCKHNIISNSSFSWWSAYLNLNLDKIVIAPKRWFAETAGRDYKDVIPENWISL